MTTGVQVGISVFFRQPLPFFTVNCHYTFILSKVEEQTVWTHFNFNNNIILLTVCWYS